MEIRNSYAIYACVCKRLSRDEGVAAGTLPIQIGVDGLTMCVVQRGNWGHHCFPINVCRVGGGGGCKLWTYYHCSQYCLYCKLKSNVLDHRPYENKNFHRPFLLQCLLYSHPLLTLFHSPFCSSVSTSFLSICLPFFFFLYQILSSLSSLTSKVYVHFFVSNLVYLILPCYTFLPSSFSSSFLSIFFHSPSFFLFTLSSASFISFLFPSSPSLFLLLPSSP